MKKTLLLLHLLIGISISSFCQGKVNMNDTSNKKTPAPKDRNMFGHGIPRGLTINSDGLADGYVMFANKSVTVVHPLCTRNKTAPK